MSTTQTPLGMTAIRSTGSEALRRPSRRWYKKMPLSTASLSMVARSRVRSPPWPYSLILARSSLMARISFSPWGERDIACSAHRVAPMGAAFLGVAGRGPVRVRLHSHYWRPIGHLVSGDGPSFVDNHPNG